MLFVGWTHRGRSLTQRWHRVLLFKTVFRGAADRAFRRVRGRIPECGAAP
jgi:hypothetical protein